MNEIYERKVQEQWKKARLNMRRRLKKRRSLWTIFFETTDFLFEPAIENGKRRDDGNEEIVK